MTNPPLKENWNEYNWELELRKDDARVNRYMNELPRYIDLPDEDAVIMQKMKKSPELAPAGGDWSSLGPVPYDDDAENGEDDDPDDPVKNADWRKTGCAPVYLQISSLVRDWSLFFAENPVLLPESMTILTFYGKLLARSADVIDMELDPETEQESCAMRIALMKRLADDLNSVLGVLAPLEEKYPEPVRRHTEVILELIDFLRNRIPELRVSGRK